MKKFIAIIACLVVVLYLAACGGSSNSGEGTEVKTTPASGDVVKAEIPGGWSLVSGTEMNGANIADFICHAENFEIGDPYLQTTKDDRDIAAVQAVLESGDPFGAYSGSKELANGTWYIAENAAAALIGDKVLLVRGYECDFGSSEVQNILGSLQWAN
ncbi:MAG: hypothetical protein ACI3XJ_02515 [Oscillospiraceae bacterium]